MLRRCLYALGVGACLGAMGGFVAGLADFGAHWLFMESSGDRVALLVRLLGLEVPAGAFAGAAAGCGWVLVAALAARLTRGVAEARRGWALRAWAAALSSLVALPLIVMLARLLWSGGYMSRLPAKMVGEAVSCGVLFALLATVLVGVQVLLAYAHSQTPQRARQLALVVFALGFGAAKLDQLVLPNLYDYLHAVLGIAAVSCFALSAALVLSPWRTQLRVTRAIVPAGLALLALLGLGFFGNLESLDQNQNVRVALLSANVAHARSLMLGLSALLPKVDRRSAELARIRATQARARRAQHSAAGNLPSQEGAHVLLITVDALRADHLGIYGYARHITPELDALGSQGVVFEHAYAQAPHSSYSLCSLMTSEYLHETVDLGQPPPTATLPRVLAAAGYHTAAFYTQGIFHTAAEKLGQYEQDAFGFALHEHQDRPAEEMTDRVLQEIDRTVSRGEPSSLFWVHYFDVHEPYEATTLGTSDLDRYDSELMATDRAIGRLLREAKTRLHKDLVVVITADHGEEFHDHGGVYHGSSVYEEQVHVPLIVLAKALPPARIATPVESIDITPTLLGLVDVDAAPSMRGMDLRALALGRETQRGPVFSAVIHKKMVVSWPHKLVADLRFGSFELYDLQADPRERDNLADRRLRLRETLQGEVYAWLDALSQAKTATQTPRSLLALEWGRLGDRRAVGPLGDLVRDEHAQEADRTEAARLLGKLADENATNALLTATKSSNRWVSAEAAIALGRMFDPRAAPTLRNLIHSEDPGIRSRAAVSLARLRDTRAVSSLIDALWIAPNLYEREEAVRWLGRLRDPRALEPLINLLPEAHTRHLVVLAMGELGDARAFEPLTQVLTWDRNSNVRDGVVRGLGMLGDARGIDVILPLASEDPGLRNTGESLVRLHALERHVIGGVDVTHGAGGNFASCYVGPIRHDWDYLHRTYCTTRETPSTLNLAQPDKLADAANGMWAMLSVRRADAAQAAPLQVSIADRKLDAIDVDGEWTEFRWPLPHGTLPHGVLRAVFQSSTPGARFELDHLLLVPRTASEPLVSRTN